MSPLEFRRATITVRTTRLLFIRVSVIVSHILLSTLSQTIANKVVDEILVSAQCAGELIYMLSKQIVHHLAAYSIPPSGR